MNRWSGVDLEMNVAPEIRGGSDETGEIDGRDFARLRGAAVVIGGSGGIGSVICDLLARRGSDVALTYRHNEAAAIEYAARIEASGRRAAALRLDATNHSDVTVLLEHVTSQFGGIHSVIVASGPHVPQRHLATVDPAMFREHLEAEVLAFFNIVQPALPLLRASRGSVVAVTTVATRRYPRRDGLSAGPKAAIESLVRAFAAEEGKFGVRLNCVGPGMLADGMSQRLVASGDLDDRSLNAAIDNIPMRTFGRAEDIAEAVCFLASRRARYITGVMLDVDGGFHL
jgi:3-oxoacyl-[acyl-carrier protein] reductase